jgi:hypothetical protein
MFWLIKGWLVRMESTGITVQDGMCDGRSPPLVQIPVESRNIYALNDPLYDRLTACCTHAVTYDITTLHPPLYLCCTSGTMQALRAVYVRSMGLLCAFNEGYIVRYYVRRWV